MSVLARFLERPASPPTIEPMRHRHISQVLDIERHSHPKPWSATVFHDELAQVAAGHRTYLVARQGRSIVGYGGLMYVADEAHVTNLVVHPRSPAHRHRSTAAR